MRSIVLAFILLGIAGCSPTRKPAPAPPAWPTQGWPRSSATAAKMDSSALAALDQDFKAGKYGFVDAMFVTRGGVLVAEGEYPRDYRAIYGRRDTVSAMYNYYDAAWHPFYNNTKLHTLQSASKTLTSIVIGVARTRGEFPTVDTAALAFFPTRTVAHLDDRKRRMTIRHLLTMTAGFDWDETTTAYTDPKNNCAAMEKSQDWVQYVLDRPMAAEPGAKFVYNSGATQLLAEIFKQATGKDIAEYAEANLFKPLGITEYYWKRTPLGLPDTEGGVYLTPADLAKLGLLYARGGKWEGQQLVGPEWVAESVKPAIAAPPFQYGFKWWLVPYGATGDQWAWTMLGYGGQRTIVLPALDIVATFTGWNIDEHEALPVKDMVDRLVAAAR